jgi:hypothetical protein
LQFSTDRKTLEPCPRPGHPQRYSTCWDEKKKKKMKKRIHTSRHIVSFLCSFFQTSYCK